MDKPNICISFILLFFFLLSYSVLQAYELPETLFTESSSDLVTQKIIEKGNVFKNPKPTSSQNLETARSGVSTLSSLKHSMGHGYKIPTLEEKEYQHYDTPKVSKEQKPTSSYDLERKRRGDSNMHRFNQEHSYKTTSSKETGKSDVPKDIVEGNKLELEDLEWHIGYNFGHGNRQKGKSNGGDYSGSIDHKGIIYIDNGGKNRGDNEGVYESTEPMNYKDASIMRHQNMKKFSKFHPGSFREYQAAKKFGMKNGDKVYYGDVPRMEDATDEDKKN